METPHDRKIRWVAAYNRVLESLTVLGLSISAIAVGAIGAVAADSKKELLVAMAGSGLLAIIALGVAGRKVLAAEAKLRPNLEAKCGTQRSEGRNHPRVDAGGKPYLMDFLGIEIWNTSPEPLRAVQAHVVEIRKPSGEKWYGKLALNFAPENIVERKNEPKNEVPSLRQNVPTSACLCSMTDRGDIMFGTLNWNWADPKPFAEHMRDTGEYVFTILLSAESGTATKTIYVALNWTKKKDDTTVQMVAAPVDGTQSR